jgi:hypothetical protein
MTYAISVVISKEEHDADREEMRLQFLSGDRTALDESDEELSAEEFAALSLEDQNEYAENELGDEWDALWYYPDGGEGLDADSRWTTENLEEAEHMARFLQKSEGSTYTVEEV